MAKMVARAGTDQAGRPGRRHHASRPAIEAEAGIGLGRFGSRASRKVPRPRPGRRGRGR